jgi:arsenite methyltransferase
MFRVLKPGGRVAVSDIALKKELPEELAKDVAALVGCIAGAISIESFSNGLHLAGFDSVLIQDSGADLNAYAKVDGQAGCCSPSTEKDACCGGTAEKVTLHGGLTALLKRYDVNDYAASVKVYAVKPG